jgi:PAS domain-containing protein
MKKYKDVSVKVKVPIMMGLAGLAVLAVIYVMSMIPLRSSSLKDAASIARLSAISAAEILSEEIGSSASVLRAYSDIIVSLAEDGIIRHDRRRQFLMSGLETFVENGKLNNVWITLEPDVLDGLDSLFVNKPGNTAQGSVSAWFLPGKLLTADSPDNMALYRRLKAARQEVITDPYDDVIDGRSVRIISVSIPIMNGGRFYGIIGTDFNLDDLHNKVVSLNSIGKGKLVTASGVAATSYIVERLGMPAEYGNREILDKLPEGKMFEGFWTMNGELQYKVYVPVQLVKDGKPWFYAVDVPYGVVYQNVRDLTRSISFFCFIGVLLISFAGWWLMQPILKKVGGLTGIIRKLSLGQINLKIDSNDARDELGVMNSEIGHLVEGLKQSTGFAHNIGEGNLDAEFNLLSDDDVLGSSLLEMRESLQKANSEQAIRAREEEQRNWGTAGLAKFAEILRRNNDDMKTLSYNVISHLVKYLDANQGGLFVMNEAEKEDERFLEMQACYAFDRKKYAEKRIRLGEGLVGTCFLEGEPIYLTQIPNEYINITSGLGDANPKAVLICPLRVNEEIYGVIELASFREFAPYQLEFVQKVSESIASTIATVRVNMRTSRLLEQTKLQTEQMANAEEELRQNMEEMQATQEEMRRREVELQDTLAKTRELQIAGEAKEFEISQFYNGIFSTCNVIELSSDYTVVNVNSNHCREFGLKREMLVGKHLSVFVGEEGFIAARENISAGRIHEDVQNVSVGNGQTRTVIQRFVPIQDKSGKLLRVLLLAFPDDAADLRKSEFEARQIHDLVDRSFNIVEFSAKGIITEINENNLKFFNTSDKSIFVGKPVVQFIGKEEYANILKHFARGDIYENVQEIDCGDGKPVTFQQRFTAIKDTEGNLIRGILLAFPDESEALRRREEILQNALKTAKEAQEAGEEKDVEMQQFYNGIFQTNNMVEYSADNIIISINDNACSLFNADKSAFVGKHMRDFLSPEVYAAVNRSINAGKIYESILHISAEGKTRTLVQQFIPILNRAGKLLRTLLLAFPSQDDKNNG